MNKPPGRILAIDWGAKRSGLAATDPLRIAAFALEGVATDKLTTWLAGYLAKEPVSLIIIGRPIDLQGRPTDATAGAEALARQLQASHGHIAIQMVDERMTSRLGAQNMVAAGLPRNKRQDKLLLDAFSAQALLQGYLLRAQ